MELFSYAQKNKQGQSGPLAARMRPITLDEYIGQEHILAQGRLLRRAIQADQISSIIFYGPPGTGKTTLASVIANTTKSTFITLNAVLSGVKELRDITDAAKNRRELYQKRTILFIDEVHRWNKAQQDALLPWVENGTIILIGATTENPYFSVNKALVSRSRIFQLLPLNDDNLKTVVHNAISNKERGLGALNINISETALEHLIKISNGDARTILNALELAATTTPTNQDGIINITVEIAEESIQQRALLYDKEGDYHFDTISAFIKSMRGSDPDAALYWMAKMISAGEDPNFIFRRMLIFASEDVGMADPNALNFVTNAAQAYDRVGMPEGRFHLGHAAIYLSTAPKSNSVFAFFDALKVVEQEKQNEVPNHLRDASRDHESFGHGKGYLYPHAYQDHWVAQQYLPNSLQGKLFYSPSQNGFEKNIYNEVSRRREILLAINMNNTLAEVPQEILTNSPKDADSEQWLNRTITGADKKLSTLRESIFANMNLARHDLVLDINGDDGLLTWEAIRQTPEGGVWTIVKNNENAISLKDQAEVLSPLLRPQIIIDGNYNLKDLPKFEAIIGRNVLGKENQIFKLLENLQNNGTCCFVETMTKENQRLYQYLDAAKMPQDIYDKVVIAENNIYNDIIKWDADDICKQLKIAGYNCTYKKLSSTTFIRFTENNLIRWFTKGTKEKPSYYDYLIKQLNTEEINLVKKYYQNILLCKSLSWDNKSYIFNIDKK